MAFSLSIERIREKKKKCFGNRCNTAADCQKKTPVMMSSEKDEEEKKK